MSFVAFVRTALTARAAFVASLSCARPLLACSPIAHATFKVGVVEQTAQFHGLRARLESLVGREGTVDHVRKICARRPIRVVPAHRLHARGETLLQDFTATTSRSRRRAQYTCLASATRMASKVGGARIVLKRFHHSIVQTCLTIKWEHLLSRALVSSALTSSSPFCGHFNSEGLPQ